ncbi:MAG: hypothetical protein VKP63_01015 [Cyanobacteriota bacterium]|nr:hypothetical protein [Cyanobacteriota bacterium]
MIPSLTGRRPEVDQLLHGAVLKARDQKERALVEASRVPLDWDEPQPSRPQAQAPQERAVGAEAYRASIAQLAKEDPAVAKAVIPGFLEGKPVYQQDNRDRGGGYLNNPFEEEGRQQIGRQFWQAPLGGHLRSALAGQEVFGHTITGGQARVAEQAAAGLLATGVGVPMFLEAVRGLTTPQTQGTIPMG